MIAPVQLPRLGELETSVMEFLWRGGSGEAKSVHRSLGSKRGITVNTIQSTLRRLFDKGFLSRTKVSHAHVYEPALSKEEFQRGALGGLVDELMRGEASAMISAFVDLTERAGPEHLERLQFLVVERRRAIERSGR